MKTPITRFTQLCLMLALMASLSTACKTSAGGEKSKSANDAPKGKTIVLTNDNVTAFMNQFLAVYTDLAAGNKPNDSLLIHLSPQFFADKSLDRSTYTANFYTWDKAEIESVELPKVNVVFSNTAEAWTSKATFVVRSEGNRIFVVPGSADAMSVAQNIRFVDPWTSIVEPK